MSENPILDAFERVGAIRKLSQRLAFPGSGLSGHQWRAEFVTMTSAVWHDYDPMRRVATASLSEQLIDRAIYLMQLAVDAEAVTPLLDVTIGNIAAEGETALTLMGRLDGWDEYIERRDVDGNSEFDTIRPIEILQGDLVRRARDLGVSWRRIGEALRMSAQGIQQRAQDRGWIDGNNSRADNVSPLDE